MVLFLPIGGLYGTYHLSLGNQSKQLLIQLEPTHFNFGLRKWRLHQGRAFHSVSRLGNCNCWTHPWRGRLGIWDGWVFPKNRGKTPQNGWWKSWKTFLKWMIWGYHHLRKHPCRLRDMMVGRNPRKNQSVGMVWKFCKSYVTFYQEFNWWGA